jgi:tetratricopeptide (TPR) repeat protein
MTLFCNRRLVVLSAVIALVFAQLASGGSGAQQNQQDKSGSAGSQSTSGAANDEFEQTFNRARGLLYRQQYKDAISEFQHAAALKQGQCAECFQFIGESYLHMKNYKESAEASRKALDLKPATPAGLYNQLGVALYLGEDKSNLAEAVEAFNQAIKLSKGAIDTAYFNLGYALIKSGKTDEGVNALKTYLKLAPDGASASEARAAISNPKMIGQNLAPDFAVKSITGEDLSLAKYRGEIILLDFWATWCGPCRQEMPAVKQIWAKYGGHQFVIIGISLDKNRADLTRYLQSEGISWPQYYQNGGHFSVDSIYGVNSIPHSVLIDQDGVIKAIGLRGAALYSKIGELVKKLPKKTEAGRS